MDELFIEIVMGVDRAHAGRARARRADIMVNDEECGEWTLSRTAKVLRPLPSYPRSRLDLP